MAVPCLRQPGRNRPGFSNHASGMRYGLFRRVHHSDEVNLDVHTCVNLTMDLMIVNKL